MDAGPGLCSTSTVAKRPIKEVRADAVNRRGPCRARRVANVARVKRKGLFLDRRGTASRREDCLGGTKEIALRMQLGRL